MKWSELSIHSTQEAIEAISNILHEAGAGGVVIEDPQDLETVWETPFGEIVELDSEDYPDEGVRIKAYFPADRSLTETVEQIKEAIDNLSLYDIDIGRNTVTISEVNEEEWATAWKKYYKPVKISEKVTVVPTWEKYKAIKDEIVVELDPGMAFGTGTHPTTRMCIQALEKVLKPGDRMIDVGTGSGVLAITAAKLGASQVTALDLDEVAVKSAEFNVNLNKVDDVVCVRHNNLLEGIEETADVITANLLAEIIARFPDDARSLTNPGGFFIASGIIQSKAQQIEDQLVAHGFMMVERLEIQDWVALIAKNGR